MKCARAMRPLPTPAALLVVACLAAACSSVPVAEQQPPAGAPEGAGPSPGVPRPSPPAPPPGTDAAFEQQTRERAERLMQDSRWADAAVQWEILTLFRPKHAEYARKLADARTHAHTKATESLAAAAEARKRGDTGRAVTLYLQALGAEPAGAQAADALREIERERSGSAHANHMARANSTQKTRSSARKISATDRRDLDTAIMLMHQGDYDASVQSLQGYLKRYPQDEMGKRALADAYAALGRQRIDEGRKEEGLNYLDQARGSKASAGPDVEATTRATRKELAQDYYEQGLRAQRTDLGAAIRLWERTLEFDPEHAQARLKLDQARRMQETLQSIPAENAKP